MEQRSSIDTSESPGLNLLYIRVSQKVIKYRLARLIVKTFNQWLIGEKFRVFGLNGEINLKKNVL